MADIAKLLQEYNNVSPLAEQLMRGVTTQLEHLCLQEEITLSVPIQARVKKWESIGDKLTRVKLNLDSIYDLQDLVGFRLIHHFIRDVQKTVDLVSNTFNVRKKYDAAGRLETDQFGYTSIHIVAVLDDGWLKLPMFKGLGGIPIEFQIRTTAQHIWAAASHLLQYKQEEAVPPTVRRAIHRVSALLETVDLEFDRVLGERSAYAETASKAPDDEPINADLLDQVTKDEFPEHKDYGLGSYAELLTELLAFKINTKKKFVDMVRRRKAHVLSEDKRRAAEIVATKEKNSPGKATLDDAMKGRFYARVGLIRLAMSKEIGEPYDEYLIAKFENKKSRRKV